MGTEWACCDPPGEAGLARDDPTVGGCLDCLMAGNEDSFFIFLRQRLICPPTRDHLHF